MDFSGISNFGWVAITILGLAMIVSACLLFRSRNVKTRFFEVSQREHETVKKEMIMTEGKDQLENQCQVAHDILTELQWILYETSIRTFSVEDEKDKTILELLIEHIIDKLNYSVRNDLTRNHITTKTNHELEEYTKAKARGYISEIKDGFYKKDKCLPQYALPDIMENIQTQRIETLFRDIYFSARRIAGKADNSQTKEA